MDLSLLKPATMLLAALTCGCLQANTLDDIRALEAEKTATSTAPAMYSLSRSEGKTHQSVRGVPEVPVWYRLSDGRQANLRDWKVVLFMQSGCQYCHTFDPILQALSHKIGLSVFPVSLDGKGDASYPDVLPATPDVMVEYFQSGLPVATPTTFLTHVHSMETWPLLQGAAEEAVFRARLDEVLRLALDHQAGKTSPPASPGE